MWTAERPSSLGDSNATIRALYRKDVCCSRQARPHATGAQHRKRDERGVTQWTTLRTPRQAGPR